jgi:predicted RNA-binding Zn-ribbon protein involved in translation (DUF1610 family)
MNWLKDKIKERAQEYTDTGYDSFESGYSVALDWILSLIDQAKCDYSLIDEDYNTWECSNCNYEGIIVEGTPEENEIRYCPHCGFEIK